MKPRVLIAAGGQRAAFLANLLHDKGYPVSLIARSRQEAENLPTEKGVDVFYGNPAKPYVLEQAGAGQAGMIAAMSESDAANLVICLLAKKRFGIPWTISLLADEQKAVFFRRAGVDQTVCASSVISGLLEQQILSGHLAQSLETGGRTNAATPAAAAAEFSSPVLFQISVADSSPYVTRTLDEIPLPKGSIVSSIVHNGRMEIPSGSSRLFSGDSLIIVADQGMEQQIATLFNLEEELTPIALNSRAGAGQND